MGLDAPMSGTRQAAAKFGECAIIGLAALHAAATLWTVQIASIHPVRYGFALPTEISIRSLSGRAGLLCALASAGAVTVAAEWIGRPVRTEAHPRTLGPLSRALWPAAVAPIGLVYLCPDERISLFILYASILLLGWSAARCARSGMDRRHSAPVAFDQSAAGVAPRQNRWFHLLVLLVTLMTAYHTAVQIGLHRALQYGAPDIAYYAEMLVNVLRGRGLRSEAFGHHFFGEHVSPGLYVLVPLWAICPRIEVLMALGAAAVTSGAIPVYSIVRTRNGSPRLAFAAGLAYLLYPSTGRLIYGASYGFHEILMAVPLMLWSFHAYSAGRWRQFVLFTVLAVCFKEEVAVVYAGLGLYLWWGEQRRAGGLLLFCTCAAYFAICVGWIVPAFNATGHYSKYYMYERLGGDPAGILGNLVESPNLFANRVISWTAIGFALTLTAPVFLLPMRRWVSVCAVPTALFIVLMDNPAFASIRFWHQSTILPVIWLAASQAVASRDGRGYRQSHLAAGLVCCAFLMHLPLGVSPISRVGRELADGLVSQQPLLDRLHGLIPRRDIVQATPRIAAHFYDQEAIYPLHQQPPVTPTWILIDVADSLTPLEDRSNLLAQKEHLLSSPAFELAIVQGAVHVFRRAD